MTLPQNLTNFLDLLSSFLAIVIEEAALLLPQSVKILGFVLISLTLFMIIFFLLYFRKVLSAKKQSRETLSEDQTDDFEFAELEELEAPEDDELPVGNKEEPFDTIAFKNDSSFSPIPSSSDEFLELEEIPAANAADSIIIRTPFTISPDNPELLPHAEKLASGEVIFEQDGIPYIDSTAIRRNKQTGEINDGFAKLVESVVNKT